MEMLWCKEKHVTGPKNSRHIFIQVPHPVPPYFHLGRCQRSCWFLRDSTLLKDSLRIGIFNFRSLPKYDLT